jgi:plastocyanin domain-containing protein
LTHWGAWATTWLVLKPVLALLAALALTAASCSKPSEAQTTTTETAATSQPLFTPGPPLEGRRIEITAGPEGYSPSTVEAKNGESLVLRFTRTTKSDCLAQVVFPEQKITRDLPLNTPIEIGIKADKPGPIPFQCGMAMVHGKINVNGG